MASNTFYSLHTHSKFSVQDALPEVKDIVARAAELEYPALALTDHGNVAGSVQLYQQCRKHGIKPMPGMEAYVAMDRLAGKRPRTWHMGIIATSERGYVNLAGISTMAHRNYRYKPVLDFGDFSSLAEDGLLEGLAVTTGCWFGAIPTLLREGDQRSTLNVIKALDGWFGSGCYIEVQNHVVQHEHQSDEATSRFLYAIAQASGVPMVLAQDSHYVHAEDRAQHETMKRLVSWGSDPEDAVFPGDGYHMVDTAWMEEHHAPDIFEAGMAGLADLASKANVVIPALDHFSLKVPDTTSNGMPDDELTDRVVKRLFAMIDDGSIPEKHRKAYSDRVDEELDVVISAGFSGYLLFAAHVTDWMRRERITFGIRGSASGSILCWLLDVSTLDPIKWGLSFERFLTRDRAKPPDIDIDMEHSRRKEVLDWLLASYLTFNISTWSEMKIRDDGDAKGVLVVKDRTRRKKESALCAECRELAKAAVSDPFRTGAEYCSPDHDPGAVMDAGRVEELASLGKFKPFSSYGVHAAGLMIAPNEDALSSIPLQYVASSKTFVTAYDKDDVEAMGMVKLDLLGIKTLTALRHMSEWTGIDPATIPLNDLDTFKAMRAGKVEGAFQLDGYTAIKGIKQLKPTRITDVIAAMALFRPATMNSGATADYVSRRNRRTAVPVRHPIIMEETKDTYGILLYQDQALAILKRFGLTVEEIEKGRKAIKASNSNVAEAQKVMNSIVERVRENAKDDLSAGDLKWLSEALAAYADYGFNLAHATSYGLLAYVTTWFSVHHPVQFWTATLDSYIGDEKEAVYLAAARAAGITFRPAHVNRSAVSYTCDARSNEIRKGLLSIKGIGEKAAAELAAHSTYTSLDALANVVNARIVTGAKSLRSGHSPELCGGVITILHAAGALEGIAA